MVIFHSYVNVYQRVTFQTVHLSGSCMIQPNIDARKWPSPSQSHRLMSLNSSALINSSRGFALEDLHDLSDVHAAQLVALLNQQIVRQHDLLHHLRRSFRCQVMDFMGYFIWLVVDLPL